MGISSPLSFAGVIAALALSAQPGRAQAVPGADTDCTVARVVDGDSFVCAGGRRVRMLLVDAPELSQRPYGETSRAAARALLPVGARVRLEFDVEVRDRFGRLLAYVYRDSTFVNRELVRRGMAVVLVYPPNVQEVETLRAAGDSARHERRGLWGASAFECSPRDYRARRCR